MASALVEGDRGSVTGLRRMQPGQVLAVASPFLLVLLAVRHAGADGFAGAGSKVGADRVGGSAAAQ